MKVLSCIIALGLAQGVLSSILARNACNADNCARAVTGTRPGKEPAVSVRMADCSSFMLTTVTAPPITAELVLTTITATTTLAVVGKRDALAERQATVSSALVPTYASACSGAVRYSSACSCWGITASITTVPAPITTITETVTLTASVCHPGDTLCSGDCYNLRTSNDNCGSCGNRCPTGKICVSGICKEPAGTDDWNAPT